MHGATRLTLTAPTKAARRVIAPYVKVIRKRYQAPTIPESKLFKKHLEKKPSVLLRDLTSFLSDTVDLPSLLHESSDVLKVTTRARGVSLYLVDSSTGIIFQSQRYFDIPEPRVRWKIEEGTTVAAHVAYKKEYIMIDDILEDDRFPMGIGQKDKLTKSVLCVPVVTPDGECYAVIELFRDISQEPFAHKDLRIATLVTDWMGAAVHQNLERVAVHKKQELNDYLLELTKVFLEEFVPVDKMIAEMVKFVKIILSADKCSFYLLDTADELVADVFEHGVEEKEGIVKNTKVHLDGKEKEIIATVAKGGQLINIRDAFNDSRFETDVDNQSGFIVRSVMCTAVKGSNGILGVIEVVNKANGCFTNSDEILFDVFATYFSLVLQYSKLNQQLKSEQKFHILNEAILHRQMGPCEHDMAYFMKNLNIKLPGAFMDFRWTIPEELVNDIPVLTYAMIKEFCEPDELDVENYAKFILGMRKYETDLPFHDFEHAFDYAHCMYIIMKRNGELFTPLEIKALLIGGLGHCVDRQGCMSNEFLRLKNDPISQLFPETPWQSYHYMITARLLEHYPIFKDNKKTDNKYKTFLEEVKLCILDTNLRNRFFNRNLKLITDIVVNDDIFDNEIPEHHASLKALCTACADFSCFCKPYIVARKLAYDLYSKKSVFFK
ncbi:hypothetical protein WA026_005955 [Henosepilachna vigintioctopunctata]|uniref:3',5'-cyclic-GMP phosphodiesterase n=1 Tax=Henosepilachna vigintioctopunctata TaxID=420089 RepID=A0AAW1TWN8_9CUCU